MAVAAADLVTAAVVADAIKVASGTHLAAAVAEHVAVAVDALPENSAVDDTAADAGSSKAATVEELLVTHLRAVRLR